MTPDLRGRLLAQYMYDELEKIASKFPKVISSLPKVMAKFRKKYPGGLPEAPSPRAPFLPTYKGKLPTAPPKLQTQQAGQQAVSPVQSIPSGAKGSTQQMPDLDSRINELSQKIRGSENLSMQEVKKMNDELRALRQQRSEMRNASPTQATSKDGFDPIPDRTDAMEYPKRIDGKLTQPDWPLEQTVKLKRNPPSNKPPATKATAAETPPPPTKAPTPTSTKSTSKPGTFEPDGSVPMIRRDPGPGPDKNPIYETTEHLRRIDDEIKTLSDDISNADTLFADLKGDDRMFRDMKAFAAKRNKRKIEALEAEKNALQNPSPEAKAKAVSAIDGEIQELEKQIAGNERILQRGDYPDGSDVNLMTQEINAELKQRVAEFKIRKGIIEGSSTKPSPPTSTKPASESLEQTVELRRNPQSNKPPAKSEPVEETAEISRPSNTKNTSKPSSETTPAGRAQEDDVFADLWNDFTTGTTGPVKQTGKPINEATAKIERPMTNQRAKQPERSNDSFFDADDVTQTGAIPGVTGTASRTPSQIIGDLDQAALPRGVQRQELFRAADSGFITGSMAQEVMSNPQLARQLEDAGVVINQNFGDDFAASLNKYKQSGALDDMPAGEYTPQMFDNVRLKARYSGDVIEEGDGLIRDNLGEVIGEVSENGGYRIFDQKEKSVSRLVEDISNGNNKLTTLAPGAEISDDALQQVLVKANKTEPVNFTTVNYGGQKYVVDPNSGRIIGKKTETGIQGVDPRETKPLKERLDAASRNSLPVPEGNNGLYTRDQLSQMSQAELSVIPRSEGGRGVQTLDDFKALEREAQEADRLWRQASELRKGGPRYQAELEALNQERKALRREYAEAREELSATLLERRTDQLRNNAGEFGQEIEESLKYLEQRKVPFFENAPLVGAGKGYVTPPTPGGILGDSSGTSKALGIGAAGLGAYALLSGGEDSSGSNNYGGQYGGY